MADPVRVSFQGKTVDTWQASIRPSAEMQDAAREEEPREERLDQSPLVRKAPGRSLAVDRPAGREVE